MERLFHAVISRSAKYQVVKSKLLLSNPPKRNLGWLLGPPPDPGTPEQKIRDRRIAALWVMVATPFLIWSGNLVVSIYDPETGELKPRVQFLTVSEVQVKLETEKRKAEEEQERLLKKQNEIFKSLPNFDPLKSK